MINTRAPDGANKRKDVKNVGNVDKISVTKYKTNASGATFCNLKVVPNL